MKLSENFSIAEFCKSQTAIRLGIDNTLPEQYLWNAQQLCENVLQKVRDVHGMIIINSGYRCLELNKIIGGSSKSQHCRGEAADIESPSLSNFYLASWISANCTFDQLILEFYNDNDPHAGWVHVSYAQENRGQVLTATKINNKLVYYNGLGIKSGQKR